MLALVVAGLTTGNKIGLGGVGLAFIVFALVSSFVLPRRDPNFPGRGMGWYVTVCILFFFAMIGAVLVFGKESEEAAGETAAAAPQSADPAAGKKVFVTVARCGGCHVLKDAGTEGPVGPDLDALKPAYAVVVHQVENGGGAMPAFKDTLSKQQIEDVSAYVASVAGK